MKTSRMSIARVAKARKRDGSDGISPGGFSGSAHRYIGAPRWATHSAAECFEPPAVMNYLPETTACAPRRIYVCISAADSCD